MDDTDVPRKKRKLEVGVRATPSTENHVTNGGSSVRTSVAAPTRIQSHLQFNPSVIQRLREITKDCQKNLLPAAKPNGSKLPLGAGNANEVNTGKNSTTAAADSSDFIISSAGSSPAHSPQPMDFEVLSTPPRPAKPKESDTKQAARTETAQKSNDDRQKACSRLLERFEEPSSSSNRTLTNGVCTDSRTLDQDSTSVEVLEEGDQSLLTDSTLTTVPAVNGEVSSPAARKDSLCLDAKEQNSPALADVAPTANAEESRGFNYNSEDFRQMLKKMIEERMTQIERSMGNESNERLASLEKENKALKEYAKKVEDSVKNLLTAEKEKARQRVTRAVQTHDPHWLTNLRTKTVTSAPPQSSVTVSRPTSTGLTLTTTPTPRLTSTVAPLPGHTVPSRHDNVLVSYRPGPQRPTVEPMRPRIPATPNLSPRPPPPGVTYVPNYDPGPAGRSAPDQPGGIRASVPGPSFSTSSHPRFNSVTVRANTLAAQPPRPVVRMQGPVVSPGGPRSIAPPSSRPLPTVTVHPQTQTPSNATSVRVQQETPSYGYATQNVYNSGQPGPRFAVAPQMRPQGPQRPQGGPPQISPGVRTPVYSQSPIQASPPQRVMQQQPMHLEQQSAQMPRPSVQIRTGPPVQRHSSPHTINQHRPVQPQQPGMAHYQPVAGPPRQAAPAQPQPNYSAVPLRPPPPPATAGMPPGALQQTPPPPQILRASPSAPVKEPPPKPSVSIAVVTSGIVLSWNMVLEEKHATVMNYQLYALQDGGTAENAHQWKKIGVVKALPLPMACTLTQFLAGNKYHFAVRGTDEMGRLGPFSDPCTITLK